jgi:hypothetical protein
MNATKGGRMGVWPLCLALLASCASGSSGRGTAGSSATSAVPAGGRLPSCGAAPLDVAFTMLGTKGEEHGDIAGVAPNGRGVRLTDDGASYDPDFTSDGSRIVFSSGSTFAQVSDTSGPTGLALYVMDADGSRRVRLTKAGAISIPMSLLTVNGSCSLVS